VLRRLVVVVALVLVGCGGGGGASSNDAATVKEMLRAGAAVQQAAQPLYVCLPEEKACYTQNGDALVQAVERARVQLRPALDDTDSDCLAQAGRLFDRSLDAYADAGRAAAAADVASFESALTRSSRVEIQYVRKIGECGFSEGAVAESSAAMREVNISLIRIGEEMNACGSDTPCIVRVSRKMEARAREGRRVADEFKARLGGDAPDCLRDGLDVYSRSLDALEKAAVALQDGRWKVAETEGMRASELGVQAERDLATCLETLGA
jgi:hypothetical protein